MASERVKGTVKWFDATKGFGFITPDDGGEDLFVHQSSLKSDGYRSLNDGDVVEFSVGSGNDGRTKAVNVTAPGGRAVNRRIPSQARAGTAATAGAEAAAATAVTAATAAVAAATAGATAATEAAAGTAAAAAEAAARATSAARRATWPGTAPREEAAVVATVVVAAATAAVVVAAAAAGATTAARPATSLASAPARPTRRCSRRQIQLPPMMRFAPPPSLNHRAAGDQFDLISSRRSR
ncbi:hypothetical protein OsJ_25920 [Oryza sativa Japonica Group]|uniref:CSD domain-containing protein n=1 Tax=Oryza sativa subsp. japonica TaxID=39947 RepID=A3BPB0_ORYSJ|nr:hypothetical protein OsJ_25920 [Oryza sativa Japonica Group]